MTASISAPVEVRGLTKHFAAGTGLLRNRSRVHAVDDLTFALRAGTITALVGESGSGKSTVARLLARLYDPTSGSVLFEGNDVTSERSREDVLRYRSRVQMIFQDPFGSLNPVKTIRHHLSRPLRIHERVPRSGMDARLCELLVTVGLVPPEKFLEKFPHELSGGQRQRVAIARALVVDPRILILDNATASVDATPESKIRAGFREAMRGRTTIIIAHRLSTIALADEVVVLDAGRIVLHGTHDEARANDVYREIEQHGLLERVFTEEVA